MSGRREYQTRARDALRNAIEEGHKKILLVGPTGCGKGFMSSDLIQGCAEKGNGSVFFADQRELIIQVKKHLDTRGIAANVVMRGVANEYDSYEADVQSRYVNLVAKDTIWSRAYRRDKLALPPAAFVQVDEAHKSLSRTWKTILNDYHSAGAVLVGWTATPCRSDGRNLGEFWDHLIQVATYEELQREGFLVPCEVFAPSSPDLKGLRRSGGDYSMKDADDRIGRDGMIGDMIAEWRKRSDDRQTVLFACTVRHSLACQEKFRRIGVTCEHIDGKMPQDQRDEIMQAAREGDVQVLCSVGCLTTGVDIPNLKYAICARPTKSFSLWRQMCGRIQRPHENHEVCVVQDHSDNCLAFGYPDEDVEWSLIDSEPIHLKHAKKKEVEKKEPRKCPKCNLVLSAPLCKCGYKVPPVANKDVKMKKGKLRRLAKKGAKLTAAQSKQDYWNQCLGWCVGTDRKVGAAAHRYKQRFGAFPDGTISNVPKGKSEWNMTGRQFYGRLASDKRQ